MHPRVLGLVFVSVLSLEARICLAENVEAKERRARTACLAGEYVEGVRLLSELFVSTMDATFIYNQGRCFEQNRRYEDAIGRFQEYLRTAKKPTKAEKADARKHIDDCKELLASEKAESASVVQAPPPSVASPPPAPVAVVSPPILPAPHPNSSPPPSSAGSGLRIAGILAASVGGAALVAGIVFNYESNSLAKDLKKTDGYSSGKESDRRTYETIGWVGYGVGAVCVAAGVIAYVIGSRSPTDPSVAFVPAFAPDYAGAAVKGAF